MTCLPAGNTIAFAVSRFLPGWLELPAAIAPLGVVVVTGFYLMHLLSSWTRRGRVVIDAFAVHVNGVRLSRRRAIRSAFLISSDKLGVRIETKAYAIDVWPERPEDASAFLKALGCDPESATAHFDATLGGRGAAMILTAVIAIAVLAIAAGLLFCQGLIHHIAAAVTFAAACLQLAVVAGAQLVAATLIVGADGLLLAGFWGKEFLPYEDLAKVDKSGSVLVLVRRDGSRLRLRLADTRDDATVSEAVARRIEDARAASRHCAAIGGPLQDLLAPRDLGVNAWLSGLRKLAQGSGYRESSASKDQLWALVSDPAKDAPTRAAAAFALRSTIDAPGRDRLRLLAQTCAEPRLRVALDAAAMPSEEALEEAYRPLQEITKRSRRG